MSAVRGGVMRSIALALAALLIVPSLARVSAQSPPTPLPSITLSPASGGLTADHLAQGTDFPASSDLPAVVFDPAGNQVTFHVHTDATGAFSTPLSPGTALWTPGLYRIAIGLPDGRAVSGTFTASDGAQHLFAQPYMPSPTSAFNFVGTSLPPQTEVTVHVILTGGHLGDRDLQTRTDANGAFSIYLWPAQVGAPFWPAGQYEVSLPQFGLQTSYWVREHPASSTISIADPVEIGQPVSIEFTDYPAQRVLWGIYAGSDGQAAGEFLIGPTNASGTAGGTLSFPDLGNGPYYIATPYDWGESTFEVIEPTPTATPTATATSTPRPTATKRPRPTPTLVKTRPGRARCKKLSKAKARVKKCKR